MKRQRTKEQAQLISKLNAYIIPAFGIVFLYLAIDNHDNQATASILILISVFLLGYGFFRVFLIKKLMKDIEEIGEEELDRLQKDDEYTDNA